jgi:hypothetical protein
MEYLIGAVVAVAVFLFALLTRFDRDRVFYPAVLIVTATYYILFAVMGSTALPAESLAATLFLVVAIVGFKRNLWLVVFGLVGHAIFDFFHHQLIRNSGVPVWWPGFCLAFDVFAGGGLALLLIRRTGLARTA